MFLLKLALFVWVYLLVSFCRNGVKGECPPKSKAVELTPKQSDFDVTIIFNIHGAVAQDVYPSQGGIRLMHSDGLAIDANLDLFTVDQICLDLENGNQVEFKYFSEAMQPLEGEKINTKAGQTRVCTANPPSESLKALQIIFRNTEDMLQIIKVKNLFARLCHQT